MHWMLLAGLLAQEAGVEVTGRLSKRGGEYDLEVRGTGPSLVEESLVGLRFRRRVNRVQWAGRAIATASEETVWGRAAHVARGAFVHREPFAGPGEVEVAVTFDRPGAEGRTVSRIYRTAPPAEIVTAAGRDARRLEDLLGELRDLAAESAGYLDDPCPRPRRGRELARRLALRSEDLRAEAAKSLLGGTIDLLGRWAADLRQAVESRAEGKGSEGMLSGLSGEPHTGERAILELGEIEDVLVREGALVLVREARALLAEIAGAPGERARRARALAVLQAAELSMRSGPRRERFVEVAGGEGSLAAFLGEMESFLDLGDGREVCPASVEGELARRRSALEAWGDRLETALRAGR